MKRILALLNFLILVSFVAPKNIKATTYTEILDSSVLMGLENEISIDGWEFPLGKTGVWFGKGEGTIPPRYFTSGPSLRLYYGNYLTVYGESSDIQIVSIQFTFYNGKKWNSSPTLDSGSYDVSSGIWNGYAHQVIIQSQETVYLSKIEVTYTYGEPEPSEPDEDFETGSLSNPLSVTEFLNQGIPSNPVANTYVKGYIVGAINGIYINDAVFSSNISENYKTNILLATSKNETSVNNCIPVQIPPGDVREALNLFDNPTNIGREVTLCGSHDKYYGVNGLKSVISYVFTTSEDNGNNDDDSTIEQEGITYTRYDDGTASVHKGASTLQGDIQIPERITKGNAIYTVKAIEESAFEGCTGITSISIPNSVISIGASAFYKCSNLYSIALSDGLTSIGEQAFFSCSELTTITLPESLKTIGDYAFFYCDRLATITLPESLTSIGKYAFSKCNKLETITLKSNLKIGDYCFYECSMINNIYCLTDELPTSESTNVFDFSIYSNATLYIRPSALPINETAIPWYSFNNIQTYNDLEFTNGDYQYLILDKNARTVGLIRYLGSADRVTIPSSVIHNDISYIVLSLEPDAFYNCTGVKSIIIPETVETIAQNVFSSCSSLESITIPASVKNIGMPTFANCDNLRSIDVDKGNTMYSSQNGILFSKDGTSILCYAPGLAGEYAIPSGVNIIGDYTFNLCYNLTGITIPETVTEIGWSAFYGCTGLTTVDIPNEVTNIKHYAFSGCKNLKTVNSYSATPPVCEETSFPFVIPLPNDCIYLIGSPNSWVAPEEYNNDIFESWKLFRLHKTSSIYMGTFDMPTAPMFRFYTELTGWNGGASIGTQSIDSPIDFANITEDNVFEYYMVYGKGSFNFENMPSARWTIAVDLSTNKVTMSLGEFSPSENDLQELTLHVPTGTKDDYASSTGWSKFNIIIDNLTNGSAVDEIETDLSGAEDNIVVYNLQGVRLNINSPFELNRLTPGLYIVNGNKVLIK